MKRLTLISMLFCLSFLGCRNASGIKNGRLVETAGNFSYALPPGWTVQSAPKMKYKIAVLPRPKFAATINVVEQTFSGSLDQYVAREFDVAKRVYPTMKLQDQKDFKTTSGIRMVETISTIEQEGMNLRAFTFLTQNGDRKLTITAVMLEDDSFALEPAVIESMKSFEFNRAG